MIGRAWLRVCARKYAALTPASILAGSDTANTTLVLPAVELGKSGRHCHLMCHRPHRDPCWRPGRGLSALTGTTVARGNPLSTSAEGRLHTQVKLSSPPVCKDQAVVSPSRHSAEGFLYARRRALTSSLIEEFVEEQLFAKLCTLGRSLLQYCSRPVSALPTVPEHEVQEYE